MKKKRKLVTLNERLQKDMYFIIPLSGVIMYLNVLYPLMEWKYNTIYSEDVINRTSIILLILQAVYLFLCTDSLEQVKNAYKNRLENTTGKINILYDVRIEYQPISALILYICGLVRFSYFAGEHETRDFDSALLAVSTLVCVVMYFAISSKRRDIALLINKNRDRFIY